MVNEACKPLPESQQTEVKAYPLQFISVEEATEWLSAICPNASFDPAKMAAAQIQKVTKIQDALQGRAARARYKRSDDAKFVVVVATPLEHLQIAKAIGELDKDLPDSYKMVPRFYILEELPDYLYYPMYGALNRAFINMVATPFFERQSIMIVATEEDHKRIADFIKNYREESKRQKASLEIYSLKRQNYYRVYALIQQVAPAPSMIFPGASTEQIAVWGTPKVQNDVAQALAKLESATTGIDHQNLRVYKIGAKQATAAKTILSYQAPGSLAFDMNPDELLVWASPADHEKITKLFRTVSEAFPEPVLKTYYFKNVPLNEGSTILNQMFLGRATMTMRPSTGDLLVHASPEMQEKVAKAISDFDVPRPAETEPIPVAYDLSDMPAGYAGWTSHYLRIAMGEETIVLPSSQPGQIVVWAKPADQVKVKAMLDQVLSERPETTAKMQTYSIQRGTAASIQPMLQLIAPNAQISVGTNPNQLLVWSKDSDQIKIKDAVEKLNESDPDVKLETYSLKNVYLYGARLLLNSLIQEQALDVRLFFDLYSKQVVVQAKPEAQKIIAEMLEKLRTPDRDLAVFQLQVVDPLTAQAAVNTLFYDESYATAPGVDVDVNTNIIFVQGTKDQLDRVRKMLIGMGENVQVQNNETQNNEPGDHAPGYSTEPGTITPGSLNTSKGAIRTIPLRGDVTETIKELEKLWRQSQPNQLRVIKEEDTPGGYYSMSDDVKRDGKTTQTHESSMPNNDSGVLAPGFPPPLYVIVNENGSLTITSQDTAALDELEKLVKRIDDRIVFEGRDYTIYSVRNISADLVAMKLRFILNQRLTPQTRVSAYQVAAPLTITEDMTTNTIYVRGPKMEREEVAKLLVLLDVSELPGERMVRKPIKVPIKNSQATRVWRQIYNVYQQKMMMTRLPGGIYPRVVVDNLTNSLEIIAPEPLATELKEYAEDIDRRTVEEPARKIHVIPLGVKSTVIESAIQKIRAAGVGN
jgi:type II secretory pathway component GspD/PulD (secretin)